MSVAGLSSIAVNGLVGDQGAQPSAPTFFDLLTFLGDGIYPTGGTPGFKATVQALFNDSRSPIAVITQDAGAYRATYDQVNDKLKVFSAGVEVTNATDLSGTTFHILVISQ
jgi:hypothetical protein